MSNLRTKIIAIILISFSYEYGYSQLTLENIFLTDKYRTKQAEDIEFLYTKPLFAKLITASKGKNIAFYNKNNIKTNEWKLSEYAISSENKNSEWNNLLISNTDKYFLVGRDYEQIYRRSFLCSYYIGDEKGMLEPLSTDKQSYPAFSPNDKKIAFIKNNNLFYKDIITGTETSVTKDGEWNKIINGKSDWVYEEELELTRAYEWNANSDKIAYLKFDESNVKEYSIPIYYDMQYPNTFTYKYPKVGERNSKVSIWLYDVKSKKNKQISLPFSYEYIPRIYWNKTGDEIIAILLNRHQDSLQLVGYNIKTKKTRQLYIETDKAYVEVPVLKFLSDNSFILTSEKNGFNQLYYYDKDGKLLKQLTSGNFEVTDIYGIDEKKKIIYFQSNEGNEIETVIYSLNYETWEKKKLSVQNGSNKANFSTDFSFFLHTFSNSKTAPQITLQQTDSVSSVPIEDNQKSQDELAGIPQKEFIKIPTANSVTLDAWIIKPKNTDSTKKYPLFMFVYGGPGNQEVLNEWQRNTDLFFNFVAEQGYVVACVDNRGSGGKGVDFKKCIYLNLGKKETEDQIATAEYLGNLSFVDKSRIGIFGWSYGGFMAANCLFEGNKTFKAAIAVAPVANWNLYDDIYTEKYMRTPQENPVGYNSFNPNILAKKLTGNLLLIHGTADDNVHFQNSIQLINALNAANKTYQLYIYPDAMHGTTGKKMRFDIYNKMYQFLKEKL